MSRGTAPHPRDLPRGRIGGRPTPRARPRLRLGSDTSGTVVGTKSSSEPDEMSDALRSKDRKANPDPGRLLQVGSLGHLSLPALDGISF